MSCVKESLTCSFITLRFKSGGQACLVVTQLRLENMRLQHARDASRECGPLEASADFARHAEQLSEEVRAQQRTTQNLQHKSSRLEEALQAKEAEAAALRADLAASREEAREQFKRIQSASRWLAIYWLYFLLAYAKRASVGLDYVVERIGLDLV
jgi:hypothetical protein